MSRITKEQKEQAAKIFKANPQVKELYLNTKGEFFTKKDLALNSVKKAEEITPIPLAVVAEATEPDEKQTDKPTVAEMAELIKAAATLDDLKEFESDDRKGVKDAVAKRKKELEQAAA